jgi:Transcriptional regulator
MEGKVNQRVKLTKELLKNSLINLMHTKPLNKITIKEICENAEINRSTFYLYYTDQYALSEDIENELLANAQKHLEKIDSDANSMQYLQALLSYIKENADIFKTLLCRQENIVFQRTFTETSLKNLKLNLALSCSEKILEYIYGYLIMGCLNIIIKWIESDFDLSPVEIADLIFRLSDSAASAFSR